MTTMKPITILIALAAFGATACGDVLPDLPPAKRDSGSDCDPDADGGAGDGDGGGGTADGGGGGTDGGVNRADGGDAGSNPEPEGGVLPGNPDGSWQNVTGSLAGLSSSCGNVSYIAAKPDADLLFVSVATRGFYTSSDGAATWNLAGTGGGSTPIQGVPQQIVFDPANSNTFYASGIYGAPGVFKTVDNGLTFQALGTLAHNDSVSIDFSDPARQTLLAGSHERVREVWRSTNGGQTWDNVGLNLPANSNHSSYAFVVNAQTFLVGCSGWAPNAVSGIFRTTNAGQSWTQVSMDGAGAHPLKHSDGSIYWPSREGGSMVRSTDDGLTWTKVTPNGTIYRVAPIELPDGRIATRSSQGVLVSADHGATWTRVAPKEPFDDPAGIFPLAYSAQQKAFFVAQATCDNQVEDDAVVKFSFDYTE